MTKGLEALGRIAGTQNLTMYEQDECLKTIEKELKRLEELEKAFDTLSKDDEKTKKLLSKEIEKNRALEIIKEKQVVIPRLLFWRSLNDYNSPLMPKYWLEQEEYDLLKEVLL